jgi:hypothetical protein
VPCIRPGAASRVVVWELLVWLLSYTDSRVQLTGGRKAHSSRRGGILSPRTPTTLGMVLQRPRWRRGGGDGRTGPMVMAEMRLNGSTSRCCPGQARNSVHPLFEGSTILF